MPSVSWKKTLLLSLLAFAILLPAFRWSTIVQDLSEKDFLVEREHATAGPAVPLEPGRYRARAELERVDPRPANPSPVADVHVGFDPLPELFSHQSYGIRWLDLVARSPRTYHFPFRNSVSGDYRWNFSWPHEAPRLELIRARVSEEKKLWEIARSGGAGSVARMVLPLGLGIILLTVLLILGGRWSPLRGISSTRHAITRGSVGYLLAGLALLSLGTLMTRLAGGALDGARWVLLPGLNEPLAAWPTLGLAALAVSAGTLAGAALATTRQLVWVIPVAALGLLFADAVTTPQNDWNVYYSAGLALWAKVDPYGLAPAVYLNPPPVLFVCALLPLLTLTSSAFLWFGFKALVAVLCIRFARQALLPQQTEPHRPWWKRPEWIGVLVCGRILGTDLYWGNMNLVVLALVMGIGASWSVARPKQAAWRNALGTWLKATPGFQAVAVAMTGRIRWAVGVLALVTAGYLASMAVLEVYLPGAGIGFFSRVIPRPGDLSTGSFENQSLRALSDRFVGGAPVELNTIHGIPSLDLGAAAARVVSWVLVALVLAVLFGIARRAAGSGPPERRTRAWSGFWAAAAISMVLVSPVSWIIHYVALYPVAVVLSSRAQGGSRLALLSLVAIAAVVYLPGLFRWANDVFFAYSALPIVSTLALLVLLGTGRGKLEASG
jgi:alpha-1,2-mannosyltransferase